VPRLISVLDVVGVTGAIDVRVAFCVVAYSTWSLQWSKSWWIAPTWLSDAFATWS
jgi:hypothetical protein